MKIVTVLGARPQFIKASPLSRRLRQEHQEVLVHTGQHYDFGMSSVFFEELGIPEPDHNLGIGGGSHGAQTGAMLQAVEAVLQQETPDLVLVYGDTNSTLAGALAAVKLHIPVAHVEAGLRSFNRRMPEEINRVVADHLAAWLFAPSTSAKQQLAQEGITRGVAVVGDIMIDAMRLHAERARGSSRVRSSLGLDHGSYYLVTVHRAENTDDAARLENILTALGRLDAPVVLPLHPRTRARVERFGLRFPPNIRVLEPLGYLDILTLQEGARCILTDSGGVQKEAYYQSVPCVTLRDETEWVETVEAGWNVLVGSDPDRIKEAAERRLPSGLAHPDLYGDGTTAEQIAVRLRSTPD